MGEFVLAMKGLALFVKRCGDRMPGATNGKITARTAAERNRLENRLAEIDVGRLRIASESARNVVRDARTQKSFAVVAETSPVRPAR